MARSAGATRRARHARARRHAHRPAALRAVRSDDVDGRATRRHRPRPARVPPAQARRTRTRAVLRVVVVPHDRLQGHGHDPAARALLPRPVRRAIRVEARARALAILHEHLPVVAARPALPADRAQRRDQHDPGQPQLDARASVATRIRAARRSRAHPSDRHARGERFGVVRRSRRALDPVGPEPPARDHDDGARGLGEPDRDRCAASRVLRIPLHAHGAVGRPSCDRVHRRQRRRRNARPQWPSPRSLCRHRRRTRGARERDRRARDRAESHRAQGAAAARAHVPRRHRGGSAHRGRRDQGGARRVRTVGRVARDGAHPALRAARA